MKNKLRKKHSAEEAKNFVDLIEALREAEEQQRNMTEEEKKNNAIKMGDIFY